MGTIVTALTVHLLGSIRVTSESQTVALSSHRQRALLAALAVREGRDVSVSELVDALWEEDPPEGARTTLQTYVSRLRRQLGDDAILHSPAGYRLGATATTDVNRARELAGSARDQLQHDPRSAALQARTGLDLWEGPSLGDIAELAWFVPHAYGLDELRRSLEELWVTASIEAGQSASVVDTLESMTRAEPLREPLHTALVRALHGCGRSLEAVRAADRYRTTLREETGLDPGPAFLAAEAAALAGDQPRPVRTNASTLPRPSRIIGRDAELAAVRTALGTSRFVNVVGPGGVGKTRLVAEVLASMDSKGLLVVELAPVRPGGALAALGASLGHHAEAMSVSDLPALVGDAELLVVLDNVEHVASEISTLARVLLDRCPAVALLTTSRQRLGVPDEHVVTLGPLATTGAHPPAVELFVERSRRAHGTPFEPETPVLREICHRLEGIPLALELAAGRASVLGLSGLLERLDNALDVVAGTGVDGRDRHASLRSVVAWSYELLDPPSQQLLGALAHFGAEFDLADAELMGATVLDQPVSLTLGRLVDASLVATTGAPGRYRLLEMIRQFAREHPLDPELAERARTAHAERVVERLRLDEPVDQLRPEVHRALHGAAAVGDLLALSRLVERLATTLLYRPDADLIGAVEHAVGEHLESADPMLVASCARLAYLSGDRQRATSLAERALADDGAVPAAHHRAWHALGVTHLYEGRFADATAAFEHVTLDHDATATDRLDSLAGAALACCYAGETSAARAMLTEHESLARALGSSTHRAFTEYVRGELLLQDGQVDHAVDALRSAADRAWDAGAAFIWGIASTVLAAVLVRERHDEALAHLPRLVDRWRRSATWTQLWTTLRLVAELLADAGDADTAMLLLAAADLDPAAPQLAGEDRERHDRLSSALDRRLGAPAVSGLRSAARELDRSAVLQRATEALSRLTPAAAT